jgi:hypothetical protein
MDDMENRPETDEDDMVTDEGTLPEQQRPRWQGEQAQETVMVETGRGNAVEVPVGAPFEQTITRIAQDAHYGRFFRVYLNGEAVLSPDEAPATIEKDARIAITAYDKAG